ncbi:hypothetical protein CROQUDRAFT_95944 [Cronartium quercuum f. sp. fusiforme G11]|uniref:Uncharacterized protein n=1 Tax=Cronartium quercuum f. sp. fusiforme G11 TaxID=708437 RepID=A0A9P6T9L3_9BASI|nr:hypothetical protein CROQUDRAFT_95944 [Cronartium quercuum f. sp. fusiforme G11]
MPSLPSPPPFPSKPPFPIIECQVLTLDTFGVADLTWGYSATQNTLLGGLNDGSIFSALRTA